MGDAAGARASAVRREYGAISASADNSTAGFDAGRHTTDKYMVAADNTGTGTADHWALQTGWAEHWIVSNSATGTPNGAIGHLSIRWVVGACRATGAGTNGTIVGINGQWGA